MRSTENIKTFTNLFLTSDDEFNDFSDYKHKIEKWEGFTDNFTNLTIIPPPPNSEYESVQTYVNDINRTTVVLITTQSL